MTCRFPVYFPLWSPFWRCSRACSATFSPPGSAALPTRCCTTPSSAVSPASAVVEGIALLTVLQDRPELLDWVEVPTLISPEVREVLRHHCLLGCAWWGSALHENGLTGIDCQRELKNSAGRFMTGAGCHRDSTNLSIFLSSPAPSPIPRRPT